MNVYEGKNIRNVGIVGHGGSGKTSLISAILFDTGATNRLGRVDDGNAPTDYDEDEIDRKITIAAKLAFCELNKNKINMLDTPGFGNFIQEARGALRTLSPKTRERILSLLPRVDRPSHMHAFGVCLLMDDASHVHWLNAACGTPNEPFGEV